MARPVLESFLIFGGGEFLGLLGVIKGLCDLSGLEG